MIDKTHRDYTYGQYIARFSLLSSGKDSCDYRAYRYQRGLCVEHMNKISEEKFIRYLVAYCDAEDAFNRSEQDGDVDLNEAMAWALAEMSVPLLIGRYEEMYTDENKVYDWE